eukprot:Protomagalhaensia_sp_Gyna_25__4193@NODE_3807_length_440_cov_3_418953_g3242_i0_p1_GENE_NODE_3807_length_440_cov_3_418953_g3242_i0NODE_3807_length_440_cov_3_418953_g3242_i0_p1_ORF_typecomplete_len141_score29_87CENPQ/PF13094_6/0_058Fib_alpha/PF08702_10/0_11DUF4298/PF14131_6/0_13Halogen_Hydrol/PF10112_9/0_13_NODE_3807_length_440_cov_3_418953_g3242_i017439
MRSTESQSTSSSFSAGVIPAAILAATTTSVDLAPSASKEVEPETTKSHSTKSVATTIKMCKGTDSLVLKMKDGIKESFKNGEKVEWIPKYDKYLERSVEKAQSSLKEMRRNHKRFKEMAARMTQLSNYIEAQINRVFRDF